MSEEHEPTLEQMLNQATTNMIGGLYELLELGDLDRPTSLVLYMLIREVILLAGRIAELEAVLETYTFDASATYHADQLAGIDKQSDEFVDALHKKRFEEVEKMMLGGYKRWVSLLADYAQDYRELEIGAGPLTAGQDRLLLSWTWAAKNYAMLQLLLRVLSHLLRYELEAVDARSEEIMDKFRERFAEELDVKSHWHMEELFELARQVFRESFVRATKGKPIDLRPLGQKRE